MLSKGTIVRLSGRSGYVERSIPGSGSEYFVRMLDGVRVAAREADLVVPTTANMSTPELRRAMKETLGTVVESDGYEYLRALEWTDADMRAALTA